MKVVLIGVLTLSISSASSAVAQASSVLGEVFAGEEVENYLRLLQIGGKSTLYPWSVRSFSVAEVNRLAPRDSTHPWASRYRFGVRNGSDLEFNLHAPRARALFNSAFPYGANDGPIWAGRGVTTAVQVGFTARYRQVSLTLAPMLFRAENAAFQLAEVPDGSSIYEDGRHPGTIDLPQRFGNRPYTRIDPGQSTLRVDFGPAALGVSTANQYWGPAVEYPLILGNNAPGFAHVFAGTSKPLNLWIGKAHGRVIWGKLGQSAYSPMPADSGASGSRFMPGLLAVFTPRGIPGLEIGGSRFFHIPWPSSGIDGALVLKPFETFLKDDLTEIPESALGNQLASAFMRWALPNSGFEVYGEFASEDHRHNLRDFLLEPDHNTGYMLGFRKLWDGRGERLWTVRGEVVNADRTHLNRVRHQAYFYPHSDTRQGHTQLGQLLGSPAAYGGVGSTLGLDLYHAGGRWSVSWRRELRQEQGNYLQTRQVDRPDVMQTLGAEALVFRGRWEIEAGLAGVYNLNRGFDRDVFNLNATLGVRATL
ncbi:MAG: capsule assembly Wzi family protein [Gemmatimonadetes bacterium]|nr:capsule assembly Wzi family protein [Gemmatimonadota bacterium]